MPGGLGSSWPGVCLSVSNSLLSWFPGDYQTLSSVSGRCTHTLTSASELRGWGELSCRKDSEALVTQPFLIILIPTSGKLDQLLVLFILLSL